MGDIIQFLRYLPLVVVRAGPVLLQAPAELRCLFGQLPGIHAWIDYSDTTTDFDVQYPLLSLPLLFDTTLATIPPPAPLRPDPSRLASWKEKIAAEPGELKVALVWAGNPKLRNDRNRSIPLDRFAPLAQVPGVRFYSVQKGDAAAQAEHPPNGLPLVNLSPMIGDFADTAAIVSLVDLVLTVDTSVAHLAGTLSRPTWLMLPRVPDWRWLLNRSDTPWYPSQRLFRQPRPGDWPDVVAHVGRALTDLAASHRPEM